MERSDEARREDSLYDRIGSLEREKTQLLERIVALKNGLISIRKSTEIMEARRFAEQVLKGK